MASSAPKYEWTLRHSPSSSNPFAVTEKVGPLLGAKSRTFQLVRNRAGSCSFNLKTNDPMAYEIMDLVDLNDVRGTVRKCVRITRNKKVLWEGPIWGISGSLDQGMMTINCVGWLEHLQHRILWGPADYSNNGSGTHSDIIAFGLLQKVNDQDPAHRLVISPGQIFGVMPPRNRFYVMGQNIGVAIQELSDIESGFDYIVDPVTRKMNLYAWDNFAQKDDVVFGYNWGPNNMKNFGWAESAGSFCNSMIVISQGAPVGPVIDGASMDEYGRFEEYNTITGANQNILPEYAEAELVVRGRPLLTYTLVPNSPNNDTGVRLFDDYDIGDKCFFTAKKDCFKVEKQAIRVFGATVALDEVGNETVSAIQLSPATAGG